MIKIISKFKAIYNPYLRRLVVKYGNSITEYFFNETEEWVEIYFNGDVNNPNYLHVQIDYDETFQLLFYPRIEGDESLNEEFGTYYNSGRKIKPRNVKMVYTEKEYEEAVEKLKPFNRWITTNEY